MKTRENRVGQILIAGALCFTQLQLPIGALAAEGDPENLALNKDVTVSALEVPGQWGGEMAVDGDREDSSSRWSSGSLETGTPQWLEVDLGSPQTFNSISLYWEASAGQVYRLEGRNSADEEWTTFYETENGDGELGLFQFILPVKICCFIYNCPPMSVIKRNIIDILRNNNHLFTQCMGIS